MSLTLLSNSLLVATATTLIAGTLGLAVALCALGLGPRGRHLLAGLSLTAFALPPFLVVNAWLDRFGNTGPARDWLPFSLYTPAGVVLLLSLMLWPVAFAVFLGAWQRIETAHLEAEPRLQGGQLLSRLLWPLARPLAGPGLAVLFALALNQFSVPALLQVQVLPAEVWVRFNTEFDPGHAALLSLPMVALPLLLLALWRRRSVSWPQWTRGMAPGLFRRQIGAPAWCGAALVTVAALGLSTGFPLCQLLADPETWRELEPAFRAGYPALLHSSLLAAATATLTLGVGLAAHRAPGLPVLWLAFLTPGVILGIGLVVLLNRPSLGWLYPSLLVVVLAWSLHYAAPAFHTVRRALQRVDRHLLETARLDGASPGSRLRLVYWPQAGVLCAVAWYLTYVLVLWDTDTLLMIMPPGAETLALRIFNFLHYGHAAQVNALCLLLLAAALLPWCFAAPWLRRRPQPRAPSPQLQPPRCLLPSAFCLLFLAGCSPAPDNEARVASRHFDRVQVFGSRGAGLGQFNKPRSVTVDRQDNFYVADMTGRIQRFSAQGEYLSYWQMPVTDLGKPKGMCCDEQGRIVVLEPHYARVNHYSVDGRLEEQWGQRGTNAGDLSFPRAIVVNPAGRCYVTEYHAIERVQAFAPGDRHVEFVIGAAGRGPAQFNRAEGLGLDAAGRLYVADSCNHRIQVFSPDGQFLRAYGHAGTGRGDLSYPYDIQVDADGFQYVCEFGNSRIQIFDAQDRPVEILGGPGLAPGQFSNPWALALDTRGNLYVADSQNHRVQKFHRRSGALARREPPGTDPPLAIRSRPARVVSAVAR